MGEGSGGLWRAGTVWAIFFCTETGRDSMLRTCRLLVFLGITVSVLHGTVLSPQFAPAQDAFVGGDAFSEVDSGRDASADGVQDPAGINVGSRALADGVLTVVSPAIDVNEGLVYPRPFPGLNAAQYTPKLFSSKETLLGQTQGVMRYRDVWQYEFAFKELRYLDVKLPLPDGNVQTAGLWYMIYRVKNTDTHLSFPTDPNSGEVEPNTAAPLADLDPNTLPGRIFPSFLLEGWVEDLNGDYLLRAYRDRVIPAAIGQIAAAEKMDGLLLDNVQLAKQNLADPENADGLWAVATWLDVDPRINFASVAVQGLSNAFRSDQAGEERNHRVKTLQINFWRPGDSNFDNAKFRLGIAYDDEDLVRQRLLMDKYRLPGPELVIERRLAATGAPVPLGYVSANYDLQTMASPVVKALDDQSIPAEIETFLGRYGFDTSSMNVTVTAAGDRWTISGPAGDTFTISVQPLTWQVNEEKIDFVGPLDYFWDFRYIY